MFPFRRILVALSGRDTDRGLLRYAAMLNRILAGAEILCLHVAGEDDCPHLRRKFADSVAELLPDGHSEVVGGDVLDSVLAVATAQNSDLILLGHSSGRRRRSLARRLSMKAPCSVWIAPDQALPSINRVLVPIDFSRISADTVSVATALAEAAGLDECLALHVEFNQAVVTFDEVDEIAAQDRDRAFGLFIAPIDLHGVWVKPLFVDSPNVAQTIVRTAVEEACDLIVMGTRGRSPSAAVLLGSETEHCLMTTPVPLLAVKHFGSRLSLLQALRDERLRKRGDEHFT
ncbi:MAG: sulfate transporter [Candidatus Solibacter sp.]|nr:sulfate transporter [Candidatus Solibacter sp.]